MWIFFLVITDLIVIHGKNEQHTEMFGMFIEQFNRTVEVIAASWEQGSGRHVNHER